MTRPTSIPEISLRDDGTRFVRPLTVSPKPAKAPNIVLDADRELVSVGGDVTDKEASVTVSDTNGNEGAKLESSRNAGRMELTGSVGNSIAWAGAEPNSDAGRLDVTDPTGVPTISFSTADRTSIELNVRREGRARTNCSLRIPELILDGTSERDDEGQFQKDHGGGEVLLRGWAPGEQPVRVHLKGERDSDYGRDAGNMPRALVDGPEGTLDLGRGPSGVEPSPEGVAGRLVIRSDYDDSATVFDIGVADDSAGRSLGQVTLSADDGGSLVDTGTVGGHGAGLMVFDGLRSSGDQRLLVRDHDEFPVVTSGKIEQDDFPPAQPEFASTVFEGVRGEAVEITVTVGDDEAITKGGTTGLALQIGGGDSNYRLRATYVPAEDARVRFHFNTDAVGDDSTDTVTVDGDGQFQIDDETMDIDAPLDSATYDLQLRVPDHSGDVVDLATLSVLEG